jgi:hypothetical protein
MRLHLSARGAVALGYICLLAFLAGVWLTKNGGPW